MIKYKFKLNVPSASTFCTQQSILDTKENSSVKQTIPDTFVPLIIKTTERKSS